MEEMFGFVEQGFSVLNVGSVWRLPITKQKDFEPRLCPFGDVLTLSVVRFKDVDYLVLLDEQDDLVAVNTQTNENVYIPYDYVVEVVGRYYPTSIEYKGLESTDSEEVTMVGNNKVWEASPPPNPGPAPENLIAPRGL